MGDEKIQFREEFARASSASDTCESSSPMQNAHFTRVLATPPCCTKICPNAWPRATRTPALFMVTSAQTVAFSDRSQALALDPVLLHKRDRRFLPALEAHFISECHTCWCTPYPQKPATLSLEAILTRPNARPGVSIKPTR